MNNLNRNQVVRGMEFKDFTSKYRVVCIDKKSDEHFALLAKLSPEDNEGIADEFETNSTWYCIESLNKMTLTKSYDLELEQLCWLECVNGDFFHPSIFAKGKRYKCFGMVSLDGCDETYIVEGGDSVLTFQFTKRFKIIEPLEGREAIHETITVAGVKYSLVPFVDKIGENKND